MVGITVNGEQYEASAATPEIKAIVDLVVKGAGVDNPNPVLPAGTCLNCVITVAGRPGAHDVGAAILQVLADGRAKTRPAEPLQLEKGGSGYQLRRHLGIWQVTMAGRPGLIHDDRAIQLVGYLLLNPPREPIHAVPLETKVWARDWAVVATPDPDPDRADDEGNPEAPDGETSTDRQASGAQLNKGDNYLLKKRFRELLEIVEDATLPPAERDAAQKELDEMHQSLDGAAGRTIDNASKTAERVRKLIRRLHAKLANAMDEYHRPHRALRDFADHIYMFLIVPSSRFAKGRGSRNRAGVAGSFVYEPPPGFFWNR